MTAILFLCESDDGWYTFDRNGNPTPIWGKVDDFDWRDNDCEPFESRQEAMQFWMNNEANFTTTVAAVEVRFVLAEIETFDD